MYAFLHLVCLIYLKRTFNASALLMTSVLFFMTNKLVWNTEFIITGGPLSALIFKLNKLDFNLFFIILIISSSSSWKSSKMNLPWVFFFLVFILVVSNQIADYWVSSEINTIDVQLINGVMSLHPALLLITYALLIKISYFMFKDLNSFFFFDKNLSRMVKHGIFKKRSYIAILLFNLFSFLLGSYWALQELNWGGYWSWDPIESYSLAILILLYSYSHFVNFNVKYSSNLLKVLFIVTMLITVRLGFVESVHAFIISNSTNNSLSLGIFVVLITFLLFILVSKLIKTPFVFKSPELMLIRAMLFIANSLASLTLFYTITVAFVSVYPYVIGFFNENLLMVIGAVILTCGYINTYNIPIIFFNLIEAVLLNYFFFHFKVRPPLRVRHTIGLSVLIMLFSHAKLSALIPQSVITDLIVISDFKLSNLTISNVKVYISSIFELKGSYYVNPSCQFVVDGLLSKSTESNSFFTIEPLISLGVSEIYVSRLINASNLSFFKPIILMAIFYFSITVGKLIYKGFFRIKKF